MTSLNSTQLLFFVHCFGNLTEFSKAKKQEQGAAHGQGSMASEEHRAQGQSSGHSPKTLLHCHTEKGPIQEEGDRKNNNPRGEIEIHIFQ
jgi:hypothetical protein